MPFRFALDSDEGFPHQGVIDFADNRVDPDTGTIQMRGVVENPQGVFVSGSRVRVRLPVTDPYTAVVVPDTAILSDQDKRYVLVVDDKNVVSRRDVSPGKLLDDGMRVILPECARHRGHRPPTQWIIVQGLAACTDQLPGGTRETVRQSGVVSDWIPDWLTAPALARPDPSEK